MQEGQEYTTEPGNAGEGASPPGPLWDHLQWAVDEAEVESFPASDPHSSWAGPDRGSLPR
jgi:hypothetical protein